jgi:hypothetical protein
MGSSLIMCIHDKIRRLYFGYKSSSKLKIYFLRSLKIRVYKITTYNILF